jgi:hypothetical protein
MAKLPVIPSAVLADAAELWADSIDKFGRDVVFSSIDGALVVPIKAFCKRPKIMGLFDLTQQSYNQERYIVIVKAADMAGHDPAKFDRCRWDEEDHAVISVTQVDLQGVVFGFRFLAKG